MLNSIYSYDNTKGPQFAEGTSVYDVSGTKVGTVSEQGVQGDNLVLQKGLFFPHDYYVPLRAIIHADADGIYLNVTKDDVTNQDFDNVAPVDTMSSGYSYLDDLGRPDVEGATSDLGHEHLLAERMPVQGAGIDVGPDPFTDRDFDIPLRGEQVVANKEARVAEEVRLHKQQITENQRVSDTVRKEQVEVEGDGVAQGQGEDVPFGRDDVGLEQNTGDAQSRRSI